MMKIELIQTSDGSDSLYVPELDETYHSIHGAMTESQHVFIENGYLEACKMFDQIRLFEVGFGTGLNALLTMEKAETLHHPTDYHAIELHPLPEAIMHKFNQHKEGDFNFEAMRSLHDRPWNKSFKMSPYFQLKKTQANLLNYNLSERYNLIYFDAFAPEKQAEMWSESIFKSLYNALESGGIMTTYCVKGIIKRRLKEIGFTIEKLAGPIGGKREMLRAIKE